MCYKSTGDLVGGMVGGDWLDSIYGPRYHNLLFMDSPLCGPTFYLVWVNIDIRASETKSANRSRVTLRSVRFSLASNYDEYQNDRDLYWP